MNDCGQSLLLVFVTLTLYERSLGKCNGIKGPQLNTWVSSVLKTSTKSKRVCNSHSFSAKRDILNSWWNEELNVDYSGKDWNLI